MKDRVWACLVNYKFKGFLVAGLYKYYQKREWYLNIFLAVASSTSIAAWTIWKHLDYLWGAIIAASQLINVIKPFLPYHKYIKELGAKCVKLDNLNLEYERFWDKIIHDKIEEDEIEELYYHLKKEGIDMLRFSDDVFFDIPKKIDKESNDNMDVFLRSNYNVTPTIN